MKKALTLIAILSVAAMLFAGCSIQFPQDTPTEHVHTLIHNEAKAPTCVNNGILEHWYCPGCNARFADEAATEEVTFADLETEELGHTAGEDDGDCTTAIACTVCGKDAVPAANHIAGEDDGDCTTAIKCANCDKIAVEGKENHIAAEDDGDCTTAIKCQNCEHICTEANASHTATADDGDCTTAIKCVNCDKIAVEGKENHIAAEDDGDVTTAVKCQNCEHICVEAKEAINLTIATFENGTVVADKKNYAVGDTVKLTITPNSGYFQKLYINGEPLMLDWKTFVYSFTATEDTYAITGSFEQGLNLAPSDWGRWDDHNQLHGVLNTYYPNNEDSWYMDIKGDYDYISVIAKNTKELANSYEGIAGGGYRIVLRATLDNGKVYAFSIWVNKDKIYAYNHFGAGGSVTGWSGAWKNVAEVNAEAAAALNGDGAQFKLERINGNKLRITINGSILETYTMDGVTEANKVVSMGMAHYGAKGEKIAIPYAVGNNMFNVTGGNWDLTNQYDGSVTILNKTGDGSTIITKEKTYTEASVTVKDFTPEKHDLSVQLKFLFDDGKFYLVRLDTTAGVDTYRFQNMGNSNNLGGSKWPTNYSFTPDQIAKVKSEGVKFTVKLVDGNAELYLDDVKVATVTLGEAYAGKTAQVELCINGNKTGKNIEIPFEVK